MIVRNFIITVASVMAMTIGYAKADVRSLESKAVGDFQLAVNGLKPSYLQIGNLTVNGFTINDDEKTLRIDFGKEVGYIPMSKAFVEALQSEAEKAAGEQCRGYDVALTIDGRKIEDFCSESKLAYMPNVHTSPFVYAVDDFRHPKKGLDGKIIAMWQSHGWYFEQSSNRWQWQRARIFETVEDLYTQSYVMPFLTPMLVNAGAYVVSPRERDANPVEIIVDNDGALASADGYSEISSANKWVDGDSLGFAYKKYAYEGFDNPFTDGTYRQVATTTKEQKSSKAIWSADIPSDGSYAVYVSYKSLPESAEDAAYTIHAAGDDYHYLVNQQMGGGTWVYLGHFFFKKGRHAIVELSNKSDKKNRVVTADAVKIGGGYGNIARKVAPEITSEDGVPLDEAKAKELKPVVDSRYTVSGYPRFTEGARYWLQWAGIPDSVYSPSKGLNDYNDDYRSRGIWVNYLMGGSAALPDYKGLHIPVDMSFAFHSDAGTTMNDSIIGTLGIYYTNKGDMYKNGTDRMYSQKLTNYVMTNIVDDVRAQFDSKWVRRGMWDASYFEARVPEVPAMLLELLSHQNFADMRYGLDPTFRFAVSRAVYKGIAEYFANVEGKKDYKIQPLPVRNFAILKNGERQFTLSWEETPDTLCNRATPEKYIVYERINDGGFKRIGVTKNTSYSVAISDNDIHSYQIVASNEGGVSFPSETLALGVSEESLGEVLVINGFTRISGPDWFDSGEIAGFYSAKDSGVPYIQDISYIGEMFEFRRRLPWMSDDSAGFGASRANYEDKVVAGNTFDYPYLHGVSIMKAGYSFVSSSLGAVESGVVDMKAFKNADLILGKQKTTVVGRGEKPDRFAIYSPALQSAIGDFCKQGGNIFVSGSYVASDVWDNEKADDAKRSFAENVLGYVWRVGQASVEGKAHVVPTYFSQFGNISMDYYTRLNDKSYAVESPDAMYAADDTKGCTLLRYDENNIAAGVVNRFDGYKTCVIGFPFETIVEQEGRDDLMAQILAFFTDKQN